MRKLCIALLGVLFALTVTITPSSLARANALQDPPTTSPRKMNVPHLRRHTGTDTRKHKGIGHAYKGAGQSAAHGGKHFARHMRHGRPIKAGRAMGHGMGGMGKGVGKGTARTGKKVGHKIKHAVHP